jgi:hypothetical protein
MAASSGAVRGYGSTVKIKVGETPVVTSIVGIGEFEFPDQTRDNLDATCLTSPNDTEEAIQDMKKVAVWALSHHYVPKSDMDVALSALEASGETFILEIKAIGADPVEYVVYLNGYVPTGISPKGIMMAKSTFTVQAKIAA